jgi:alpha-galactosidase
MNWSAPSLAVEYGPGRQVLELKFERAEIDSVGDSHDLRLVMRDRVLAVEVTSHYRVRSGSDVIERHTSIANDVDSGVTLRVRRLDSAHWALPESENPRVSTVRGHWGSESQLQRAPLPYGEFALVSRTGTTGHHANPWLMIDDGTALEDHGEVHSIALHWSGSWRLIAQRRPEGAISVLAGYGHEHAEQVIGPGQSVHSPTTSGLWTDGGFGAASRVWHEYARTIVSPHGDEVRPVLYNSWEATAFDVSEEGQIALAERAAAIGVELFVVDDGWFGRRSHDSDGLGDWYPRRDRFPAGLHALAERVRSLGMGFGLWVEPEMVNEASDLYREHPDWVIHEAGRQRRKMRNQLVLNFARDDVQAWAREWLDRLVSEYDVTFLKWDMNRPFSQTGWPENPGDAQSLWFRHTQSVYDIMRFLTERHPRLRLESCSGGGGRVDLGMLSHVDQFWTSDNTDARDRQSIQHGFSQVYPAGAMVNWVTDSPNPITRREIPLKFRFHVAMAGVLGIGGDLAHWDDSDLRTSAAFIAQYKGIRDVIQHGALYRLGGEPGSGRSALQYVLGPRVVLLSYEPHRSLSTAPRRVRLHGLNPEARYRDADSDEVRSGRYLMNLGVELNKVANRLESNGSLRFSNHDYLSHLAVWEERLT